MSEAIPTGSNPENDSATRIVSPFTLRSKIARQFWKICEAILFTSSPVPFFGWRRLLLRCFGAKIAETARIYPGVVTWAPWNLEVGNFATIANGVVLYTQGKIIVRDYATISQESYICTGSHDYRTANMLLWTAPVTIGHNAWVAARAFIHPGVTVGKDSVVGACAVVTRDVAENSIVAGNPAVFIKARHLPRSQ